MLENLFKTSKQLTENKKKSNFLKILFVIVWSTFSVFAGGLVVGIGAGVIASLFPSLEQVIESTSPTALLTLNALVYLVALIILTLPLYRYFFGDKSKKEVFGLNKRLTLTGIGMVILAFGAYFITSGLVTTLAGNYLPFVDLEQPQELGFEPTNELNQLIIIFIMLVLIAPLAEELIFRGFIFKALRERITFWPATIIVSILFGIAHGQWNVGIDTFVLSVFLCGLREYSGSLWASILLHSLKNLLAFTLLFLFPDVLTSLTD